MTQPAEAVGGSNDTVVAAEPTLQDRFAAISGDEQEIPEEEQPEGAPVPETELTPEDDTSAEAEEPEDDPPITPPVSLTAEEKEAFATWPREAQETISRRVTELEKGLHSKTLEGKNAVQQVTQQAAQIVQQAQALHLQQMAALLPEIPARPSHQDPDYAYLMDVYDSAVAQHQYVQQVAQQIASHQQQVEQASKQQQQQVDLELLQDQFPDYLDAAKGPELKNALRSTALALGYTDDQLAHSDARDVLAIRKVHEFKVKADKYDALMANKMKTVRDAKNLPNVSRPGQPQGRGAAQSERYQADRQAMRQGDRDAGARVFAQFLK